jgi:predicted negative regulator of RcsB-dependent stress response
MIDALTEGNGEELQAQADILIAEHTSTDYALMAHLALARQHVTDAEFEQAEAALQQVVGSAGQRPLAYIARTRLAAVQLQTGQYDQAMSTLAVQFPDQFAAIANELRGDILALQGKNAEAVEAYRKAQSSEPAPANVEFLQRKLNDLGSTS